MRRREVLSAVAALSAWPVLAQAQDAAPRVDIRTSQGVIVVELAASAAPITAANFLHYVDAGRFDGSSFYRAARAKGAPDLGLIEGGLKNDPAKLFRPIAHESTTKTGLLHTSGTISMAREAPGTAAADFFICIGDAPYLDAHSGAPGDNAGYAAFGHVVDGMDVVRQILAMPTSDRAPSAAMRGQMLDPPVRILTMRRGD